VRRTHGNLKRGGNIQKPGPSVARGIYFTPTLGARLVDDREKGGKDLLEMGRGEDVSRGSKPN